MADYDVAALSLTTPPSAAPVTTYRPAVRVRNNGIHPANVSGVCRLYRREPPGDLLQTWSLSLLNLVAGDEGDALASGYWKPTAEEVGLERLFTAIVTTDHDQVEPNNHLAPVTVLITAAEPPPPAPVANHATQHEHGGADQLELDDLHGRLADAQIPDLHKPTHQAGGADQLNVTDLPGILLTPQPTAEHGNERHTSNFATMGYVADAVNTHDASTPAHAQSANLEHTANKGIASGYAPLNAGNVVPAEYLAHHSETHESGQPDELDVTGLHGILGDPQPFAEHKAAHENGGLDEIAVSGLAGLLADPQTPLPHHNSHEDGEPDELDVTGLLGILGDPQNPVGHHVSHEPGGSDPIAAAPPSAHKTSHQNAGDDELSIAGLSGKAADPQDPTSHTNTAHSVGTPSPVAPGGICLPGSSENTVRADHIHQAAGGIASLWAPVHCQWNEALVILGNIPTGLLVPGNSWRVKATGILHTYSDYGNLYMALRLGTSPGWADNPVRISIPLSPPVDIPGYMIPFDAEFLLSIHNGYMVAASGRLLLYGWSQLLPGQICNIQPPQTSGPLTLDPHLLSLSAYVPHAFFDWETFIATIEAVKV